MSIIYSLSKWRFVLMLIRWPYIVYHVLCNFRQQGSPKHCREVGGLIHGYEISSLFDWKLARWFSCALALAYRPSVPKKNKNCCGQFCVPNKCVLYVCMVLSMCGKACSGLKLVPTSYLPITTCHRVQAINLTP